MQIDNFTRISRDEVAKAIDIVNRITDYYYQKMVGQRELGTALLITLIVNGHILIESVPGLAKTTAAKTMTEAVNGKFSRIQCTPDLLPSDIVGTQILNYTNNTFETKLGPVHANFVLLDEINRSSAKTQSAMLEVMQEHQTTIGGEIYPVPDIFMVIATQNPIEQEGTYSLPEAELDRFMLKVLVPYPTPESEISIVKAGGKPEKIAVNKVLDAAKILECRAQLENVKCADEIIEYIVSLVNVTRPETGKTHSGIRATAAGRNRDDILKYIAFGVSPRGGIALCQCAKAAALFEGRSFVLPEDVKKVAPLVLRHRFVLSYEAAADGVTSDDLIAKILSLMPVP